MWRIRNEQIKNEIGAGYIERSRANSTNFRYVNRDIQVFKKIIFPYLKSYDWSSGVMLLQKTEPLQGYHTFHSENLAWHGHNRTLAWMLYLNDIEEGGETEFLYQQLKIKPKRNTFVIWSGSFTHLHRGNPPISGTKYILTGWFANPNPNSFRIS